MLTVKLNVILGAQAAVELGINTDCWHGVCESVIDIAAEYDLGTDGRALDDAVSLSRHGRGCQQGQGGQHDHVEDRGGGAHRASEEHGW